MGPLELRVEKTIGSLMKKANAKTEIMLGLIDLRIDRRAGTASITNVYFDEPGEVNVSGNLRSHSGTPTLKHNTNGYSPYRYVVKKCRLLYETFVFLTSHVMQFFKNCFKELHCFQFTYFSIFHIYENLFWNL